MKPWDKTADNAWVTRYAERCIFLKQHRVTDPLRLKTTEDLALAFRRVYRAVAFDIDGTLTAPGSDKIDGEMAGVVGGLLQRSVPVILITGRGTGGAHAAAGEIREHNSALTDWYFRRLQCVTHNGVTVLRTPTNDPSAFLGDDLLIGKAQQDVEFLRTFVNSALHDHGVTVYEITREPHSVRATFRTAKDQDEAEAATRADLAQQTLLQGLFVTRGTYKALYCLDFAWTNKRLALEYLADTMGVAPDRILRIGDQGQMGGNDYDLLNSSAGFSVDQFDTECSTCHPVLDETLTIPLKGVDATRLLLKTVLLFPPLSLSPVEATERVKSLRRFERLALLRSREETLTVTQRIRGRLHYLLVDTEALSTVQTLEIGDIYDPFSGAVKLRDWELDELSVGHPARSLFDLTLLGSSNNQARPRWSMYSDTGILLRGSAYYTALDNRRGPDALMPYYRSTESFLSASLETLTALLNDKRDLTRYKLVLGIQDNVRNILLQLLYSSFIIEAKTNTSYPVTSALFTTALLPHTEEHLSFLLDPEADWHTAVIRYSAVVSQVIVALGKCLSSLQGGLEVLVALEPGKKANLELFKWRECDNFLQNFAAINLGFHELRQRSDIRALENVGMLGLAYGGTELPALAHSVARRRGVKAVSHLAKVSTYGDAKVEESIRKGEDHYISEMLARETPMCPLGPGESIQDLPLIILDDNCTTGVTLQLARDVFVKLGADVIGAIIVRFPTANRHVHMTLQGRGFVDPEVLFSFVRGLIAPSPYTRLLGGTSYVDQRGSFDKSKDRIRQYLTKNSTPAKSRESGIL